MKHFRPIVVIPFYNHLSGFKKIYADLKKIHTPLLIVDDGSNEFEAKNLEGICKKNNFLYLKLDQNCGKGKAVLEGMKYAIEKGYSHALQIDADGQHEIHDIPSFLELSKKNPKSIISGDPIYGKDAPKSRLYGRKITKFWVWIETFGAKIPDTMCGFRVYPLDCIKKVLPKIYFMRMGFDTEIIVKCYLNGIQIIDVPTRVSYPKDGISHFNGIRDNFMISLMHTHLCIVALLNYLNKWRLKCTNTRK